jgi:hypothetical protein
MVGDRGKLVDYLIDEPGLNHAPLAAFVLLVELHQCTLRALCMCDHPQVLEDDQRRFEETRRTVPPPALRTRQSEFFESACVPQRAELAVSTMWQTVSKRERLFEGTFCLIPQPML